MLWRSSGDPLAILWLSLAILSGTNLDKTGQNCQNWTEVDNVLFGRFTFDPSKAQTLNEY